MENTLLYNFYISGLPENFQTYRNLKKISNFFFQLVKIILFVFW